MNNIVDSENNESEEEIKIEKETLKRLKIYIIEKILLIIKK